MKLNSILHYSMYPGRFRLKQTNSDSEFFRTLESNRGIIPLQLLQRYQKKKLDLILARREYSVYQPPEETLLEYDRGMDKFRRKCKSSTKNRKNWKTEQARVKIKIIQLTLDILGKEMIFLDYVEQLQNNSGSALENISRECRQVSDMIMTFSFQREKAKFLLESIERSIRR